MNGTEARLRLGTVNGQRLFKWGKAFVVEGTCAVSLV